MIIKYTYQTELSKFTFGEWLCLCVFLILFYIGQDRAATMKEFLYALMRILRMRIWKVQKP